MLKIEQETSIVFNAEENTAIVWSANPVMQRQFVKLGISGTPVGPGLQYEVPKRWVKIGRPRQVSDERRKAMRQSALSRGFGKVRTFVSAAKAENAMQSTAGTI